MCRSSDPIPSDREMASRRSWVLSTIPRVCNSAGLTANVQSYDDLMDFIRLTAYSHGSG
jgi:hypothetical protein